MPKISNGIMVLHPNLNLLQPKAFLPFIGVPAYTEMIEEVVNKDYKGFIFDRMNIFVIIQENIFFL